MFRLRLPSQPFLPITQRRSSPAGQARHASFGIVLTLTNAGFPCGIVPQRHFTTNKGLLPKTMAEIPLLHDSRGVGPQSNSKGE